jgi:signal transduction histidine kinase
VESLWILEMPPELGRLKPEVETAIFRIVQEALTNVHRHSGAQNVCVRVEKNDSVALVTITDNGRGISKEILDRMAAGKSGVGVTGMRERVKELGGKFAVRSGSGTTVSVQLPLTD